MRTGICPFCGKKVDKFIMYRGDVVGCRFCGIHAKETNADRIRAMTDYELAHFIDEFWSAPWCPDEPPIDSETKECMMHEGKCELCILDWLKQEATDG